MGEELFMEAIKYFTNDRMFIKNIKSISGDRPMYFWAHVNSIVNGKYKFEDTYKVRAQGLCSIQTAMKNILNADSEMAKDIILYWSSTDSERSMLIYHSDINNAGNTSADEMSDLDEILDQ